eukprot:scaffold299428_cov30-Tisochrysis_lutea.AAC.1
MGFAGANIATEASKPDGLLRLKAMFKIATEIARSHRGCEREKKAKLLDMVKLAASSLKRRRSGGGSEAGGGSEVGCGNDVGGSEA